MTDVIKETVRNIELNPSTALTIHYSIVNE